MQEKQTKKMFALDLEVEELEKGRRPGGCATSSSTSPMCTCPCREFLADA